MRYYAFYTEKSHPMNMNDPNFNFPLQDYHCIRFIGKEAEKFTNAQFANRTTALQPMQWHWNCYLTPQGRVIALFLFVCITSEEFLLIIPKQQAVPLATQLQRFVFRTQVKITVDENTPIFGQCLTTPSFSVSQPHCNGTITNTGDLLLLEIGGCAKRKIAWSLAEKTSNINHEVNNTTAPNDWSLQNWQLADLYDGLPWIDPEKQKTSWTPHALELDRLQAFSIGKGCYPGQEIVARTHFLGRSKKQLALCTVPKVVTVTTDTHQLTHEETTINPNHTPAGDFIAWQSTTDKTILLAVIQQNAPNPLIFLPNNLITPWENFQKATP